MEKIMFALFVFFAGTDVIYAQINLINTSLIIPDSNTAFVGVENVYEIVNADKGTYTLSAKSSKISSALNTNSFIVTPHHAGADTFQLIKNGKPVYTKIFTLANLPPPEAALGAITKNSASKQEIIANRGLVIKASNFRKLAQMEILSFTVKIKSNNIKEGDETMTVNGNLLSEKVITVIKTLTTNDVIAFDNIKARGADSRTITLYPFSITIK